MKDIQKLLNDAQYEAVTQTEGSFLILAGAGSGKTRVITYKIAHLINKGIPQEKILAVTFTNKAAKEMKERVNHLLHLRKSNIVITTFHSLGVRILKSEITKLNYRNKFSIYDENDRKKILKDIVKELKLSEDKYDPYDMLFKISDIKMERKSVIEDPIILSIYNKYQEYLKIYNAVDFDDLIKLPLTIFEEFPEILKKYQKKWKYILVDEYQDTSLMQYRLIKMLAKEHKNISVVGDDDQSIYSWRGANTENIIQFEADFYPVKEIRLEQNYRSTGNILKAANNIIKINTKRKPKELWTSADDGEVIGIYEAEDEETEADFVFKMISRAQNTGIKLNDIGILFRMNSQSRPLEEVFRENDIFYKLLGAMKFFDRPEVRDILSYMRFLANTDDEVALFRIINNPKRGIGNSTLMNVMEHAKVSDKSLFLTIKEFIKTEHLGKRTTSYLKDFIDLIEKYREQIFIPKNMARTIEKLVDEIDYRGKLINELRNQKKVIYRISNIEQLIKSISKYEKDPDNFDPNIYEYLQRVSLTNKDDESNKEDSVNMMSVHSAKGLEFRLVFIVGAEEGLMPHSKTIIETGEVEEERRLFYVAITRAKEKVIISYPKVRVKYNESINKNRSPFIEEIPEDLIKTIDIDESYDSEKALKNLLNRWNN